MRHQYLRSFKTVAGAEGSMRVVKGGDAVVGYGSTPYFSEFSKGGEPEKRGKLLFDAELPKGDGTYRVLRDEWEGMPNTLPKLVAERESLSEVALYASWNGATNVASWQVLGGESAESLAPLGSYPWTRLRDEDDGRERGHHVRGSGARQPRPRVGELGASLDPLSS